jgi:hypothetical protein
MVWVWSWVRMWLIRTRFDDWRFNDDIAWINNRAWLDDNLWFEMSVRNTGMIWIHGGMGMSNRAGFNNWVDDWIGLNDNLWFRCNKLGIVRARLDDT